jgi:hypothetical protein
MIWLFWTAAVLFILNFEGSALTTKHRHEHRTSSGLAMTENPEKSELDDELFAVWRQVLVEGKKRVLLGDDSYPVQRTSKNKLAQVDFDFADQRIRGLEQNPATSSRWAELARNGSKVMQFLIGGRYIAAIADGKITHFSRIKQ